MASGSIERRGESWRARYRHPDTKRQHQKTFPRKVDAQRWLRDQLGAIDTGNWVDPRAGQVTLRSYFTEYAARQVWTHGTHQAMDLAIRSTPFVDTPLARIKTTHVEAWVKAMSATLAPGTIKTRLNNVRSVFRAAIRDRAIVSDPTEGVRLPRQRRAAEAMQIPTPEQVRAVLEASDERFRAFVAVCAFAGLRLGEAAALQAADVDFLRRQIYVRRQVQRNGKAVEIRLPKYGSERTVPIPDELASILSQHVALPHRGEWLFQGAGDTPPHQNTVGYWWRQTLKAAGVEGVRLHDLRHFYASGLIASGCDVVTVQRALGHARASVTLDTYSKLWPTGEDRTRNAAAGLISEVLGENVGKMWAGGVT